MGKYDLIKNIDKKTIIFITFTKIKIDIQRE